MIHNSKFYEFDITTTQEWIEKQKDRANLLLGQFSWYPKIFKINLV